ncbi:MAG: hypothetical protein QGG40_06745 [Myxococcota bacterium]|nr:hypothetical protein [Myxococcota bacterium]
MRVAVVLLVLLAGCFGPADIDVVPRGVEIEVASLSESVVHAHFDVQSGSSGVYRGIEAEVSVADNSLDYTIIGLEDDMKIVADQVYPMQVVVKVPTARLGLSVVGAFLGIPPKIVCEGNIVVSRMGITRRIPFDFSEDILSGKQ